jgi:hypothetical protein
VGKGLRDGCADHHGRHPEGQADRGHGPGFGRELHQLVEVDGPARKEAAKIQPLDQGEHQAVLE